LQGFPYSDGQRLAPFCLHSLIRGGIKFAEIGDNLRWEIKRLQNTLIGIQCWDESMRRPIVNLCVEGQSEPAARGIEQTSDLMKPGYPDPERILKRS
jgi:hypothetical protein